MVFVFDVIRRNVEVEVGRGSASLRDLMVLAAFVLLAIALFARCWHATDNPVGSLGFALVATSLVLLALSSRWVSGSARGSTPRTYYAPPARLRHAVLRHAPGGLLRPLPRLVLLLLERSRALQAQTTHAQEPPAASSSVSACSRRLYAHPETAGIERPHTACSRPAPWCFAVVNSFRLSWIVYLTKREKIVSLLYSFFLFVGLHAPQHPARPERPVQQSLLYYSYPLTSCSSRYCIFGNVYFGDGLRQHPVPPPDGGGVRPEDHRDLVAAQPQQARHPGVRLSELVNTVTTMTLQVCEARSCWLELIACRVRGTDLRRGTTSKSSGMKNITHGRDRRVTLAGGGIRFAMTVLAEREARGGGRCAAGPPLRRTSETGRSPVGVPGRRPAGVPCRSVGILYATKESEYGFFKDDVDVVSAFADQATVAIENSRLIKKSIERERLLREMMLAQEMQRKLLPQTLPDPGLDIDAVSTPAFEVGGTTTTSCRIDDHRLGIVVGDVSGKGVSAAFYMSEVKGIFQSLGRLYPSPREFMIKANEALAGSIDKHSFISLIYVVLDLSSGTLTLSRAGIVPCCMSPADRGGIQALGHGTGPRAGTAIFARTMEEHRVTLRPGDMCVLYTDGVTEAGAGTTNSATTACWKPPTRRHAAERADVKEEILESVRRHVAHEANEDDLTIVVLKWNGNQTAVRRQRTFQWRELR